MYSLSKLALFAFVVTFSVTANSATYYVDKNHSSSSDSNSGTEASPWQTIQHAANVLVAGDTVYVKQGVYKEVYAIGPDNDIPGLKPQNSGTAGNPITYEAFPGDVVVVDQQNSGTGFHISNRHYITVRGFEIRNVYGPGGVSTNSGSSNITVENCYIHDVNWGGGTNVGGIRFDWVVNPVARNNRMHTIRVAGQHNMNAAGIISYGMENALIEYNEMYDAYNGVYHKMSSGNIGALIQNNIIHDVNRALYYDVAGGGSPGHVNQRVTKNIIYSSTVGVHMDAIHASPVNDGFLVWNNVIQADDWGVQFANARNVSVYNNIFTGSFRNKAVASIYNNLAITEIDFNNYFHNEEFVLFLWGNNEASYNNLTTWQSMESYDLNSSAADPMFVDAANHNYQLKSGSPAIGSGKGGLNMGAYPNGNETIGPSIGLNRPVAPANFRVN